MKLQSVILLIVGLVFFIQAGFSNHSYVPGQELKDGEDRAEAACERIVRVHGWGFTDLVLEDTSFVKAEITKGKLLITRSVPATGSAIITSVDFDQSQQVRRLDLALSFAPADRLFKWKTHHDKYYAISFIGLAPGQYACNLVESDLTESYSNNVSLIEGKVLAVLRPLSNAIIDDQIAHAGDQVWYDFIVGSNHRFELFISTPRQLVQWHYGPDTGWRKRATFPFDNRENFTVINDGINSVLITETLKLYLIGANKLIPIKTAAGLPSNSANEKNFLVINRDGNESYVFTAEIGMGKIDPKSSYRLKDRKLETMVLSPQLVQTFSTLLTAADQK